MPPLQVIGAVQATPQAPQFALSLFRSLHTPASPQSGARSEQVHFPALHCVPGAHELPHVPQLAWSFAVFTHTPEHEVVVVGHVHAPAVHTVPPVQVTPQAPQSSPFVWRSTHALAQFVSVGSQPALHAPRLHT
jgi:hypothetical protein